MILSTTAFFLLTPFILACEHLEIESSRFPILSFRAFTSTETREAGFLSGRASYVSDNGEQSLYLYHTVADPISLGVGRWVLSEKMGANNEAVAFVDSWAVMPNLVHAINDPHKSSWQVHDVSNGSGWVDDPDMTVRCVGSDNTVYIEVHDFAWPVSGFYIQNGEATTGAVYSHVRANDDYQLYLSKVGDRWVLGETPGVMDGIAYVDDSAETPSQISNMDWAYVKNDSWMTLPTAVLAGDEERNLYATLRDRRTIKSIPADQTFHRLRNDLAMPSIGLGTGGIDPSAMERTLYEAISAGYRLFDLARESGNEAVVGEVLNTPQIDEKDSFPFRDEVFLTSKVWPTHLGFDPTSFEISQSLSTLQTPYIDLYMINWPWCNPNIEWMHCEDAVNPEGLWIESYMALERAYAEGRIASIGLSNFNVDLLWEVSGAVNIAPHVVQNLAEPGNVDLDVRLWCSEFGVVYTAYSSQQGIAQLSKDTRRAIRFAAENHGVSQHAIITGFFLQTGAAVIPRSTNPVHLRENIKSADYVLNDDELYALGWPFNGRRYSDEL